MAKRNRRGRGKRNNQQYYVYGVMIAFIILIAAYLAYTIMNAPPDVAQARLEQEAFLGTAGAPVQIIEYGAYGCSSCRAVHGSGIIQQVLEQYSGQVQLVFRNWPVISPANDPLSAQAAQCALDQGTDAFWTYHDALYALTNAEYSRYHDKADFVSLADEAGLDGEALRVCLDNRTHQRTVEYWKDQADRRNLRGTPTFFVNGQRLTSPGELDTAVQNALGVN